VVDLALVSHADSEAHHAIQRYLAAFADGSAAAVVAPARVDSVRKQPWLAGWNVTDCTSRFELVSQSGGAAGRPGDDLIFETSGTVGDPKMVRYRKSTIRDCAKTIAETLALDSERDYISLANPRFAYGLSIIHSHFTAGVPVQIRSAPVSLDSWAALRDRLGPNSSVYLGPHDSFLLGQDATWRLEGPIELIFAGGAVTQFMVDRLKASFPDAIITNMYGQSELGPRVSIGSVAIDDFQEGDVGRPLPGVNVRIGAKDDDQGTGIIEVDSPFRMTGYVTMTGAEPADVTGRKGDSWWPTGDVGYLSNDGHLHVLGRSAADINFLGSRVRLSDVQAAVRAVDGVVDARVSAVPHEMYGQRPSIRVLVDAPDDAMELTVRKALGNAIGNSAGAVLIKIIDLASLPDSGKL
jgi:acyl-coenzyme A synthetase/AMP-(fatty) acid ligase